MRILLIFFLVYLAGQLVKKVRAQRQHRKLVRQLKDLGVYGGTIRVKTVGKQPQAHQTLSRKPDGPIPFGYKTAWLALKCQDPRQVAAALNYQHIECANWETGLSRSMEPGGAVFFSPVLDGFILVIGYELFALADREDELEALAAQFAQVQYFADYRVSSTYCWARYEAGYCVRAYRIGDGQVLWNTGSLTSEEQALGFSAFPIPDAKDAVRWPDEEDVLNIAAAWGIDPRFERKMYPPSVGWICD